jgi:hypothetical protein
MISHDPLKAPPLPPDLLEMAKILGMKIVFVSLAEMPDKVEYPQGKSFYAMTHFIPREGDVIQTQDELMCEVKRVVFDIRDIAPPGKTPAKGLFPMVFAILGKK